MGCRSSGSGTYSAETHVAYISLMLFAFTPYGSLRVAESSLYGLTAASASLTAIKEVFWVRVRLHVLCRRPDGLTKLHTPVVRPQQEASVGHDMRARRLQVLRARLPGVEHRVIISPRRGIRRHYPHELAVVERIFSVVDARNLSGHQVRSKLGVPNDHEDDHRAVE